MLALAEAEHFARRASRQQLPELAAFEIIFLTAKPSQALSYTHYFHLEHLPACSLI